MKQFTVLTGLVVVLAASTTNAVSIDWVTVGDPGNACDSQPQGCFGSVADVYRISKYEVTNAQYAEFLNAVAAANPHGLYNPTMSSGPSGGITQGGSLGSYFYNPIAGRENMPVNNVSFYDTLRFANWLHNGQPTGPADFTTTEDGAYLLLATSPGARKPGAQVFVPNDDEWYKAAYFNGTSYFDYPAASDTQITCAAPGSTPNTANCLGGVGDLSNVGSYTNSASSYGTFDQGGNVREWNETILGLNRVLRGGQFLASAGTLAASERIDGSPLFESYLTGFRVASIPEPSTALLLGLGLTGLAGNVRRRNRS